MFKHSWFNFFLAAVLLIMIAIDLRITNGFISRGERLFLGSNSFPGGQFLPLRSALNGIRRVGYYSDLAPKNPDVSTSFMFTMQRAQFALAPTMLDHYTPFVHEHIILYLKNKESLPRILKLLKAVVVVNLDNRIVLIRRILP